MKEKEFLYEEIIINVLLSQKDVGFTAQQIYEEVFDICVSKLDAAFLNGTKNINVNKNIKGLEKLKLGYDNIFNSNYKEKKNKVKYEKLYDDLLGNLKYEVLNIIKFNLGDKLTMVDGKFYYNKYFENNYLTLVNELSEGVILFGECDFDITVENAGSLHKALEEDLSQLSSLNKPLVNKYPEIYKYDVVKDFIKTNYKNFVDNEASTKELLKRYCHTFILDNKILPTEDKEISNMVHNYYLNILRESISLFIETYYYEKEKNGGVPMSSEKGYELIDFFVDYNFAKTYTQEVLSDPNNMDYEHLNYVNSKFESIYRSHTNDMPQKSL